MRFLAYRKPLLYSFAIGLGLGCASVVLAAWSGPLSPPPTCTSGNPGCDAPLNVSSTGQIKAGNLTALGLSATSAILSPEFCIGSSCITSWPSAGGASQWTTSGSSIYYNGGNVGIGTANPTTQFQILGTGGQVLNPQMTAPSGYNTYLDIGAAGGNYAELEGDSSGNFDLNAYGGANGVFQSIRSGAVANTLVLKAGNVGIGTANPWGSLTLGNSATYNDLGFATGLSSDPTVSNEGDAIFTTSGGGSGIYSTYGSLVLMGRYNGSGQGNVYIGANDTPDISVLESTGNVGIGTTNPQQLLDLNNSSGSASMHMLEPGVAEGGIGLASGSSNFYITNEYGHGNSLGYAPQSITLTNSGNVGIGKTNPNYTLDVNGSIGIGNNGGGSTDRLYLASGDPNHSIYSTGSNGNETYFWEWGGNFNFADSSRNGNVMALNAGFGAAMTVWGNIVATGGSVTANAFYYNSDERLKTNIATIASSTALADVLALTPVTFNWINPALGTSTQIGFIAQQVQQVVPEIVTTDASTTMESVDYARVTPLLVGSVQELDQKIEDQQSEITTQQTDITAQQQEIDTLTAEIQALEAGR
ncbi:MAG: tail fiber domain-containing protein [Xanthobacteraceae bacterium]|jgi:polyhydroxyalkanoate synthesis regulator phasin